MVQSIPGAREAAIEAALASGRILRAHFGQVRQIRHKGEIDLVTEVDEASEAAVAGIIRARFPHHRILAEEGSAGGDDPRFRWIGRPTTRTASRSSASPSGWR